MYAIDDLKAMANNLSGWSYIAVKQLQLEHRRTFLGTAWIVLAYAATSVGIGVVMAQLQGIPIRQHVPYVMFGFVAWNFIQQALVAGCNVYVNAKPYLLQMPTPRSVFAVSLTLRGFYLLLIQFATAMVISALLGWRPGPTFFWALLALPIFFVTSMGGVMMLGMICTRFRDICLLYTSPSPRD